MSFRRYRSTGTRVPPIGDPRWSQWAKPLLEFLMTPRDWKALTEWSKKTGVGGNMLRQLLAWAEHNGKAQAYYRHDETILWSTVTSTSRRPRQPRPPVVGEPDEGSMEGLFGGSYGEREIDDDPIVPGVPSPEDELVGSPGDGREV